MKLKLLDTVTGETRDVNEPTHRPFDWCENNWSCDCNRCTYFGLDHEDLGKEDGICFGEERFIVIAVENIGSYTLLEYNEGYPKELLKKHGVV